MEIQKHAQALTHKEHWIGTCIALCNQPYLQISLKSSHKITAVHLVLEHVPHQDVWCHSTWMYDVIACWWHHQIKFQYLLRAYAGFQHCSYCSAWARYRWTLNSFFSKCTNVYLCSVLTLGAHIILPNFKFKSFTQKVLEISALLTLHMALIRVSEGSWQYLLQQEWITFYTSSYPSHRKFTPGWVVLHAWATSCLNCHSSPPNSHSLTKVPRTNSTVANIWWCSHLQRVWGWLAAISEWWAYVL